MEAQLITRLETNISILNSQLNSRVKEEFYFKPDPDSWSMIEVLSHLVDEEVYDFRARILSIIENPEQPLPSFDPLETLAEKNFVDEDFNELLDELMAERIKSIALLRTIENELWDKTYEHSSAGKMSARFFLTNWVAHDYIHIQQINRLAYQYLTLNTKEELAYAGNFRF